MSIVTGTPEISHTEIQILEEIGGGQFGKVYRGMCRGKEVAIKKLLADDLTPEEMAEFRKEVEIMTQNHHPNVVLFMGACFETGHLAMVTELLKANLEKLLHDKNVEISMARRLQWARDAALGVNWLHCSTPQIIHRDLKPANLLVDSTWTVKVCDFGLSSVKEHGKKIKDQGSIPGTPIWMAPEVLLGRQLDEKADVYSFGIVLWEILTGQEPFLEMTSFKMFKKCICMDNVRPPLPKSMPEPLKELLERCWAAVPQDRPSMAQVIQLIDDATVDVLCLDDDGRKFWKSHFLGKDSVSWPVFRNAFCAEIGESANETTIGVKSLFEVVAEPGKNESEYVVSLEKFGNLLNWFGPMDPSNKKESVLDRIRDMVSNPWFHGDISRGESEKRLSRAKKGTYLVRASVTEPSQPFTISKMSKNGKINHQRIGWNVKTGVYTINITFKTGPQDVTSKPGKPLDAFLKNLSKDLYLKEPCPGSKFEYLFVLEEPPSEGYLAQPPIYDN